MNWKELAESRVWRRFGLREVWGWPLLFFSLVLTALLSYAFDAVRLGNYSLNWIPINLLSFALALGIVLSALALSEKWNLTAGQLPVFNLLLAGVAMGLKNVVTLMLCSRFGIEDQGSLVFRFVGGFALGLGLILMYGNLLGARLERQIALRKLQAKENSLIRYRENVERLFEEEQQAITKRTSEEIIPRLLELQKQVQLTKDVRALTSDLQKLLSTEIKPLSESLARDAKKLQSIPAPDESTEQPELRIALAKALRPLASSLLVFVGWWLSAKIFMPVATTIDIIFSVATYLIVLSLFKLLVFKIKPVSMNVALAFVPLPGFIAALPGYLLLYQVPHETSQNRLIPTFLVVGSVATMALAHAYILDCSREVIEQRLQEIVSKVSKENKVFEQKLWVAQHVWYTLLHGSVQSALTAASIRVGNKKVLSDTERKAILKDIKRAITALKKPTLEQVDLTQSIKDLRSTWSGICEIAFSATPTASKALKTNADASLIVNEVIKEAVSNSVKHGSASHVSIELDLEEGLVKLAITNDGVKPKTSNRQGIGSNIFDALCLTHSLSWETELSLTVFKATITLP